MKPYKTTVRRKNLVDLFIFYKLHEWSRDLSTNLALGDCLFEVVKLTKNNVDPDKYGYSCGI